MVHDLIDRGESVVVLDNLSTGKRWLLPRDVPLVVGSTGDFELVGDVIRTHGVQAIVHFAASKAEAGSVARPLSHYENNAVNSGVLLEAAVDAGVKHFIFSSTAAVYGEPQ